MCPGMNRVTHPITTTMAPKRGKQTESFFVPCCFNLDFYVPLQKVFLVKSCLGVYGK